MEGDRSSEYYELIPEASDCCNEENISTAVDVIDIMHANSVEFSQYNLGNLCNELSCLKSLEEKIHVAVIESSESDDEEIPLEVKSLEDALNEIEPPSVIDENISQNLIAEIEPLVAQNESEIIKNSHCIEIKDDDFDQTSPLDESPKYVHKIDFNTWLKLKKENKPKKIEKEPTKDESSDTDNKAWVAWMCKKKSDELKTKIQKSNSDKKKEREKKERDEVSQKKYNEWLIKKSEELKKQNVSSTLFEEKRKPKITRHVKWEDWHERKKSLRIPKTSSHINYPKPTWVNPNPWQNPDNK